MSVRSALDDVLRGFGLDDQVTLTELRRAAWVERLQEADKLRLAGHNDTVAIVVSPDLWRGIEELAAYALKLEEALEVVEIDADWGERLGHVRRAAPGEARRLLELLDAPRS